jgi:hypothetical protein
MEEKERLKMALIILSSILIYLIRWELLYLFLILLNIVISIDYRVIILLAICVVGYFSFYLMKKILQEKNDNQKKFFTSIYQSRFERDTILNRSFNESKFNKSKYVFDQIGENEKKTEIKNASLSAKNSFDDIGGDVNTRNLRSKEKNKMLNQNENLDNENNYEKLLL